ncbi:MAG: Fur family transcriptional regulator [Cardiobacteriaceae bacterium]|nr:Fur family transcriptional regulator [Cardiobacteriaceae bacterium]
MSSSSMPAHTQNIPATLQRVKAYCEAKHYRATPIRMQILELVLAYPDVVKAYEVLADLQKIRGQAAPPTVYRALEFWVEVGVLHRTEALNGYVYCAHFDHPHASLIFNCYRCHKIEEIEAPQMLSLLSDFCNTRAFTPHHEPLIVNGTCDSCQQALDSPKSPTSS